MAFTLRKYQKRIIKRLRDIYKESPKAFLQMVTGSGKTITAFELVMQEFEKTKKPVKVAWTAHQTGLIEQSYTDLLEFLKVDFDRNNLPKDLVYTHQGITFLFDTWQTLRNSTENFDMLIVDECHYGSSLSKGQNKRDHKSFHKVLKLSPKHLYVSATPWNLNMELFEDLFDEKRKTIRPDRVAIYTMGQAKKDGFVCDMSFCIIQSVDTLEIKRLESEETMTGKFSSIEESSEFIGKHQVSIKHLNSIKKLRQSTLYSLLDAYFAREAKGKKLPPTLVFCKTRSGQDETLCLENVVKTFKKRAKNHFGKGFNIGNTFIDYVASDVSDSNKKIQEFKAGKINVLCVVGMAREGFNYPPLSTGIDLSPSFKNIRLATQKAGRFIRPSNGKIGARYYYADTIEHYVEESGVRKELSEVIKNGDIRNSIAAMNNIEPEDVDQDSIEALAGPLMTHAQFARDLGENGEETTLQVQKQSILPTIGPKGEKKKVRVTEVGFLISDAENTNPEQNIRIESLFGGLKTIQGLPDPSSKKEQLLKLARSGQPRPKYNSKNREEVLLANVLGSYVGGNGHRSYDADFSQTIKKERPDWFFGVEEKTQKLLEWIKEYQKRPNSKSLDLTEKKWGLFIMNLKKNHPELLEELRIKFPVLKDTKMSRTFTKMMELIPSNVLFVKGQIWKGIRLKYEFIDSEYGSFYSSPGNLMTKSWPNGYSGHQSAAKHRVWKKRFRKVINNTTGETFDSSKAAAHKYNINMSIITEAISRGRKGAGYKWAYVDENEE